MADGRMLNRAISQSKKMANLSTDTSRLLFTWMVPHLDREGRMKGTPSLFWAQVCPRLTHITMDQVGAFLKEWHEAGLVLWYEAGDEEMYLQCVGWERQQRGFRKDREAESRHPSPTPELVRSSSASSSHNGMERNKIERGSGNISDLLEEVSGYS